MSNTTKEAKFKVGELAIFRTKRVTIKRVIEHAYFYGVNSEYYEYEVEFADGSPNEVVFETALDLIEQPKQARICECGAWSVHWAANEHSRWCAAYTPFERNDI